MSRSMRPKRSRMARPRVGSMATMRSARSAASAVRSWERCTAGSKPRRAAGVTASGEASSVVAEESCRPHAYPCGREVARQPWHGERAATDIAVAHDHYRRRCGTPRQRREHRAGMVSSSACPPRPLATSRIDSATSPLEEPPVVHREVGTRRCCSTAANVDLPRHCGFVATTGDSNSLGPRRVARSRNPRDRRQLDSQLLEHRAGGREAELAEQRHRLVEASQEGHL
jgi:hypothetical protein